VVIYEAPGRLRDLVDRIAARLPERELCMCREISKRFEEVVRLPARQLSEQLASCDGIRGECVLVVGPGEVLTKVVSTVAEDASLKDIAAALASRTGQKKRAVYQMLLDWERDSSGAQ
jgi:16S rRNA (cytidine1402-2'-O)-methyltransferase